MKLLLANLLFPKKPISNSPKVFNSQSHFELLLNQFLLKEIPKKPNEKELKFHFNLKFPSNLSLSSHYKQAFKSSSIKKYTYLSTLKPPKGEISIKDKTNLTYTSLFLSDKLSVLSPNHFVSITPKPPSVFHHNNLNKNELSPAKPHSLFPFYQRREKLHATKPFPVLKKHLNKTINATKYYENSKISFPKFKSDAAYKLEKTQSTPSIEQKTLKPRNSHFNLQKPLTKKGLTEQQQKEAQLTFINNQGSTKLKIKLLGELKNITVSKLKSYESKTKLITPNHKIKLKKHKVGKLKVKLTLPTKKKKNTTQFPAKTKNFPLVKTSKREILITQAIKESQSRHLTEFNRNFNNDSKEIYHYHNEGNNRNFVNQNFQGTPFQCSNSDSGLQNQNYSGESLHKDMHSQNVNVPKFSIHYRDTNLSLNMGIKGKTINLNLISQIPLPPTLVEEISSIIRNHGFNPGKITFRNRKENFQTNGITKREVEIRV